MNTMLLLLPLSLLLAPQWSLPIDLSDANTTVRFSVDSTWHLVQGSTRNISGKAWLKNPADPRSVHGELSIPVGTFDTESSRRDARLREVMAEPQFPAVRVVIDAGSSLCLPDAITPTSACHTELTAQISIRGVTKSFALPTSIEQAGNGFLLKGELPLQWGDFGVEDPSIFIAKLKPTVTVTFEVRLQSKEPHA